MTATQGSALADIEQRDDDKDGFLAHVVAGLSQEQKTISSMYLYDQRGSMLFDQICALDEYYPTRTELALLEEIGPKLAAEAGPRAALVEFGSGADHKIRRILNALPDAAAYVPVDISREFLLQSAEAVAADFPSISVIPVVADFSQPFKLPEGLNTIPDLGRVIGLFPGSTIGNLMPDDAIGFLANARRALGAGSAFLVGVDLKKSEEILHRAYNDEQGVTADFNLNLLTRMNRELGADFDLDGFSHRAVFNHEQGRIEMHITSRKQQQVRIDGHVFDFAVGETIRTEVSYKYHPEEFQGIATDAGWRADTVWIDKDHLFSLHFLTA